MRISAIIDLKIESHTLWSTLSLPTVWSLARTKYMSHLYSCILLWKSPWHYLDYLRCCSTLYCSSCLIYPSPNSYLDISWHALSKLANPCWVSELFWLAIGCPDKNIDVMKNGKGLLPPRVNVPAWMITFLGSTSHRKSMEHPLAGIWRKVKEVYQEPRKITDLAIGRRLDKKPACKACIGWSKSAGRRSKWIDVYRQSKWINCLTALWYVIELHGELAA